jgi:beta-lactamase regulating signal transducer with metallopeptidase domain
MVFAVIIPITIVGILGIVGYLVYRFVIFDYLSNKSVNDTLRRYDIDKSQFEIVKEYYEHKGEKLPEHEINRLTKFYRQKEPEQFLAMYDSIREKSKTE